MVYLKALNLNLVPRIDDYDQGIKPAQVMFCHDSNGIMDNSYSGLMRDKLGVTSWGHLKSEPNIFRALNLLYWYRKYSKKYKIGKIISYFIELRGIPETKRVLAQTFHTVNGLLIKKFMALGPEIVGYRDLADQTARIFRELFSDYIQPVADSLDGFSEAESVYAEIKDFLNKVKSQFHKPSREERLSWLFQNFRNRALGSFFGTEFRRLIATVNHLQSSINEDYTESLAWVFRATTFCQTRVLGYLPNHIAEIKRYQYRNTVNRPIEKLPAQMSELIYSSVVRHLDKSKIPMNLLQLPEEDPDGIMMRAISNVALDIKQSASTDSTVSEGGKIEDARKLINLALKHHWTVPVRDFNDHKITEYISIPAVDSDIESWSRPIFWISYQIVLNFWIARGKWSHEDYHRFPVGNDEYSEDILLAKILHISEPGKERNLTKCKATYAWFLTPAGKLCQSVLANLPEHRAGLEMAAHDWMHTRRISSESEESGFIYCHKTGRLMADIVHSFKDWTESTDFISKYVGLAHLRGLMNFIGFPIKYRDLLMRTIISPQPVEEIVHHKRGAFSSDDIDSDATIVPWTGAIREGYMMGNPITKTILHLVHVSELEIVSHYLQQRGVILERGYPLPEILDRPRIPRLTRDGAIVKAWKIPFQRPFTRHRGA
jgi:hypothetical protein